MQSSIHFNMRQNSTNKVTHYCPFWCVMIRHKYIEGGLQGVVVVRYVVIGNSTFITAAFARGLGIVLLDDAWCMVV